MTFAPSQQQLEFFDWVSNGSGSCVLEAVAGSGKTTTLVRAVGLMQGSIFLGAFNKSMADELKERIGSAPGKFAGTFHSAGFGTLRRAVPKGQDGKPRIEINEHKTRDLLDDLLPEHDAQVEGLKSAICHLVSLAKQTGFRVRGLVEHVRDSYWRELIWRHDVADRIPEDYPEEELIRHASRTLEASIRMGASVVDFDDMIYLPLLFNLRLFRNDWVLIDEAQDTNAIRREMASRMLRPGGRLVAVGDPHQAIYGFTGADGASLDMIRERFRARTMSLSVSWRCPRAVVEQARVYVSHIEASPTAAEGSVATAPYRAMVAALEPGDAVLCRYNAPLVELCFRLIRDGKRAKIEGRSIGEGLAALMGRWKVVRLDAFENRILAWNERELGRLRAAEKPDERKIAHHSDKFDTVMALLDRGREQGMTTVRELQDMVRSMFADNGRNGASTQITLSSVHKSKGLEWDRVYLLGRGEIMPPTREMQPWQKEQEINLCYVAVTRSKAELIDVPMPTPEDLKRPAIQKKETA